MNLKIITLKDTRQKKRTYSMTSPCKTVWENVIWQTNLQQVLSVSTVWTFWARKFFCCLSLPYVLQDPWSLPKGGQKQPHSSDLKMKIRGKKKSPRHFQMSPEGKEISQWEALIHNDVENKLIVAWRWGKGGLRITKGQQKLLQVITVLFSFSDDIKSHTSNLCSLLCQLHIS